MRLKPIDIEQFKTIIQSCSGPVTLITAEGDRLVVNSCLCRKVGLERFLTVARQLDVSVACENQHDQRRIENFLSNLPADTGSGKNFSASDHSP